MTIIGGVSGDQLRSYIERIERLEEEKAGLSVDVREVFAEAKANGFDTKTMKQMIKLRAMDANERDEQEHMIDLYKRVLGMTPTLESEDDES